MLQESLPLQAFLMGVLLGETLIYGVLEVLSQVLKETIIPPDVLLNETNIDDGAEVAKIHPPCLPEIDDLREPGKVELL